MTSTEKLSAIFLNGTTPPGGFIFGRVYNYARTLCGDRGVSLCQVVWGTAAAGPPHRPRPSHRSAGPLPRGRAAAGTPMRRMQGLAHMLNQTTLNTSG